MRAITPNLWFDGQAQEAAARAMTAMLHAERNNRVALRGLCRGGA